MKGSAIAASALMFIWSGSAAADEAPADTPIAVPENAEEPAVADPPAASAAPTPVVAPDLTPLAPQDGRSAIDAWDDARGIRYGTDMLFPFTRGMEDAGIRGWARYPVGVLTVPLDVALLPAGLIAGLWGG